MGLPISFSDQLYLKKLRFKLNRTRRMLNNKIRKETNRLKKEGKSFKEIHRVLDPLMFDKHSEETILGDTINAHITESLLSEARRLFLTIPFVYENEEMWSGVSSIGDRHLTNKGINELKSIIRKERQAINRERNEGMKGWGQFIAILTGLVGALTGLLALFQFYKH